MQIRPKFFEEQSTNACVMLAFLITLLLQITSCSDKNSLPSPFEEADGIKLSQENFITTTPSGLTGDGQLFVSWRLNSSVHKVQEAVSNSKSKGLLWNDIKTDKDLSKILNYYDEFDAYSKFRGVVNSILDDPSSKCAYVNVAQRDGEVRSASIWLCSPQQRKLIYLRAN